MMSGDMTYEMRINQSKLRVLKHTSSTQGTTNFLIFTENQNIINKYFKCQENIKKMSNEIRGSHLENDQNLNDIFMEVRT